jgi:hypothetical protein
LCVCWYVYVHINIPTNTYVHMCCVYLHVYAYAYTHLYAYACTRDSHMSEHTQVFQLNTLSLFQLLPPCTHTSPHLPTHPYTNTATRPHPPSYPHIHPHTYTYTYRNNASHFQSTGGAAARLRSSFLSFFFFGFPLHCQSTGGAPALQSYSQFLFSSHLSSFVCTTF